MRHKHEQLLKELERILWEEWDPIGINDEPLARSEYDSYALEVLSCCTKGCTAQHIGNLLYHRQTVFMGCNLPPLEHSLQVAERCVAAHLMFID